MTDVIFDGSKNQSKDKDVADTSKEAYKEITSSGEKESQKVQVLKGLDAMQILPTIDELCNEALAGWQKSTVSGRINNLNDLDLIVMAGKRESQYSGIKSKTWMLTNKGEKVLEEIQE